MTTPTAVRLIIPGPNGAETQCQIYDFATLRSAIQDASRSVFFEKAMREFDSWVFKRDRGDHTFEMMDDLSDVGLWRIVRVVRERFREERQFARIKLREIEENMSLLFLFSGDPLATSGAAFLHEFFDLLSRALDVRFV